MAADYTYIAGRLNAIEAEMPERSWYERLVKAETGSLIQILREYYQSFEEVDSIYQFAEALEMEKAKYLDLISKLIPDDSAVRFLRAEHDFNNLGIIWKSEFLDVEAGQKGISPFGLTDADTLKDAVENGSGIYLPSYLKDIFDYLNSISDRYGMEEAWDFLERKKWEYILEIAPSAEAEDYTRMRIDILNIKNFIRLKRTGLFVSAGKHWIWIPGGRIDVLTMKALFSESEDALHSYLSYSPYSRLTDNGLDSQTPSWRVDPLLSGEIHYTLSERRHSFFDISPVIYHLENMNRNHTTLRCIITGKINQLPEEIINDILEGLIPS